MGRYKKEYKLNKEMFRQKKSVAKLTLEETGERMGISAQMVCQAEQKAIRKIVEGLITKGMDDMEAILATMNLFGFRDVKSVTNCLDDGHIIRLKLKYTDYQK